MRVYKLIKNPNILRQMKIYEYTAEAKDFKIHDFMAAENKKQASEKIKKVIAKLGYQQPKTLNIYSTRYWISEPFTTFSLILQETIE